MEYRLCTGIIFTYIGDQAVLVATEDADPKIPLIRQLNETAGLYCNQIAQGAGFDQLYEFASGLFDAEPELIRKELYDFIIALQNEGYLTLSDN